MTIASVASRKQAPPDILRWLPGKWDLIVGNVRLKRFLRKLLAQLRDEFRATGRIPDVSRLSVLITGESRSSKTALIKHFVRCLMCKQLDEKTLDPCDKACDNCKDRFETVGLEGLFSYNSFGASQMCVHFVPVDCAKIQSSGELRGILLGMRDYEGLRILYFDEVHRFVQKNMEEMLLKEVEEKNFMWFFSTAKPHRLEDMFINRLVKVRTELPEAAEMEAWLADRCDDWGIPWMPEAIQRVVDKSNRVVGTALHALVLANLNPEGLTLDLVDNDWSPKL